MTASAGNDHLNTDTSPHVPSTLTTPNVIAVSATQKDGTFWAGSNYGEALFEDPYGGVIRWHDIPQERCSTPLSPQTSSRGGTTASLTASFTMACACVFPGAQSVDVAAPGVNVLGLAIGGAYISMTGTSMATPHVTGVAAILLAKWARLLQFFFIYKRRLT